MNIYVYQVLVLLQVSSVTNRRKTKCRNSRRKKKVLLGIEPRSPASETSVITTTLQNLLVHIVKNIIRPITWIWSVPPLWRLFFFYLGTRTERSSFYRLSPIYKQFFYRPHDDHVICRSSYGSFFSDNKDPIIWIWTIILFVISSQ